MMLWDHWSGCLPVARRAGADFAWPATPPPGFAAAAFLAAALGILGPFGGLSLPSEAGNLVLGTRRSNQTYTLYPLIFPASTLVALYCIVET